MAEVSLRLLRSKARPHKIKERLLCGRKYGGSLFLLYQVPTGVVASEDSHRLGFYTMWPSGTHRDRCLDRQRNPSQEVRLYSQWSGSRASHHQNNHRRNGPNGAQDLGDPLYKSRTGYYDILEVTGNATQSQIKTAYYKQSFRFHPDRNSENEDAARLFGLVTEAYHVLGSVSLRKKYDRGILSLDDVRSAKKPSGKSSSPSRREAGSQREASTASNSRTPAKPMFDFDAFYQAHYGEQLAREQYWKARREDIEKKKLEKKKMTASFNKLGELSSLLLFISATIIIISLR